MALTYIFLFLANPEARLEKEEKGLGIALSPQRCSIITRSQVTWASWGARVTSPKNRARPQHPAHGGLDLFLEIAAEHVGIAHDHFPDLSQRGL